MLGITIYEEKAVAVLEPDGPLSAEDFQHVSRILDPFIEEGNILKGLIIKTEHFPGWDNFTGFLTHMKFIKSHHKQLEKVALVTDSPIGAIAERISDHFISANVKTFTFSEFGSALYWTSSGSS